MGRVRHPIYGNSGEVKCGYQPKKGINIARRCVNGYSITAAPAKSVTHVLFWWCVNWAHSDGGEYATRPVAWATGRVRFSVKGYEVPSEPSEPSGTAGCFRRNLGLLLMQVMAPRTHRLDEIGSELSWTTGASTNAQSSETQWQCRHHLVHPNAAIAAKENMTQEAHSKMVCKNPKQQEKEAACAIGCELLHIDVDGGQLTV